MPAAKQPLLTTKQVQVELAKRGLDRDESTIRRWLRDGTIRSVQPGPRKRRGIPASEVERIARRGGAE